jgi:RimJ/RimL family protein N-acetyltransferase
MNNNDPYPLPPGWQNFAATRENITRTWVEMNKFPILFDDFKRGDFKYFMSLFMDPDNLILQCGDYGLARVRGIQPGGNCEIHLTFWDRRFKGRQEDCRMGLRWLFYHFKLERATIIIVESSKAAIKFIRTLGFQQEGVLRRSFLFRGEYLNSIIFGILKEEVFNEDLQKADNQSKKQ